GDRCVGIFSGDLLVQQGCALHLPLADVVDGCYGPDDYRICVCRSKDNCNDESLGNATLNKDAEISCFENEPDHCKGASCH
ncbi:hypothetical protein PMAYCL1PPCAC_21771, partial [Pristionchus mayeri]